MIKTNGIPEPRLTSFSPEEFALKILAAANTFVKKKRSQRLIDIYFTNSAHDPRTKSFSLKLEDLKELACSHQSPVGKNRSRECKAWGWLGGVTLVYDRDAPFHLRDEIETFLKKVEGFNTGTGGSTNYTGKGYALSFSTVFFLDDFPEIARTTRQ